MKKFLKLCTIPVLAATLLCLAACEPAPQKRSNLPENPIETTAPAPCPDCPDTTCPIPGIPDSAPRVLPERPACPDCAQTEETEQKERETQVPKIPDRPKRPVKGVFPFPHPDRKNPL